MERATGRCNFNFRELGKIRNQIADLQMQVSVDRKIVDYLDQNTHAETRYQDAIKNSPTPDYGAINSGRGISTMAEMKNSAMKHLLLRCMDDPEEVMG